MTKSFLLASAFVLFVGLTPDRSAAEAAGPECPEIRFCAWSCPANVSSFCWSMVPSCGPANTATSACLAPPHPVGHGCGEMAEIICNWEQP